MGKVAMVGSKTTKESETRVFSGATVEAVADKVALFMAARGYRLESGTKMQGVYGTGSAAAHAMLGAMVKRQKYNITVVQDGENVALVVAKGMTGMSGGLLSARRVKKEFAAIMSGLQESILS
jgi:tetrahydromethanopterin S-methyltransferase subunit F